MRINPKQAAFEVAAGALDLPRATCSALGLVDRVSCQQFMNGIIGRDKGQSVGKLKTLFALKNAGCASHGRTGRLRAPDAKPGSAKEFARWTGSRHRVNPKSVDS